MLCMQLSIPVIEVFGFHYQVQKGMVVRLIAAEKQVNVCLHISSRELLSTLTTPSHTAHLHEKLESRIQSR